MSTQNVTSTSENDLFPQDMQESGASTSDVGVLSYMLNVVISDVVVSSKSRPVICFIADLDFILTSFNSKPTCQ